MNNAFLGGAPSPAWESPFPNSIGVINNSQVARRRGY